MKANRAEVANALCALGYAISRTWHFKAREERTPSAYINTNGRIHDFGNGFHGDLASFLVEYRQMNLREALDEARRLLGMPLKLDFARHQKPSKKAGGFISENYIAQFEKERAKYFERYKELLNQALPALNLSQQRRIAKRYRIGYSHKADRLIMPIRDEEGRCVTLWKYNANPLPLQNAEGESFTLPKVMFTKGRPRNPFNLQDLKRYALEKDEWIFLCEGEKDCLNALGRGYRAITLGGATERICEKDLPLFSGLKIIIVYDYDRAGQEGIYGSRHKEGILSALQAVTSEIKVWDWELLSLQEGFKLKQGFDFTDWLTLNKAP